MGIRDFINSKLNTIKKGDYKYTRYSDGWHVSVLDTTKTSYGPIESEIGGMPIVSLYRTFEGCKNLTTAPEIPNGVTNMGRTFYGCTSLTTAPVIPNSVTDMHITFSCCTSLTDASKITIPQTVEDISFAFAHCVNLINAPNILNPKNIKFEPIYYDMELVGYVNAFYNCPSLILTDNQKEYYVYYEHHRSQLKSIADQILSGDEKLKTDFTTDTDEKGHNGHDEH